jgi:hypothetical protein
LNCEEGFVVFEEVSARYTSEGSRVSKERPPITLTTKHQQNTNNTAYAANHLESNIKQTFRPPKWDRRKLSRPTTKAKRRSRSFSFCGKPFSRFFFRDAPRPLSYTTSLPIRQFSPSTSILLGRYRHITSIHYLVPIIASEASNGNMTGDEDGLPAMYWPISTKQRGLVGALSFLCSKFGGSMFRAFEILLETRCNS